MAINDIMKHVADRWPVYLAGGVVLGMLLSRFDCKEGPKVASQMNIGSRPAIVEFDARDIHNYITEGKIFMGNESYKTFVLVQETDTLLIFDDTMYHTSGSYKPAWMDQFK